MDLKIALAMAAAGLLSLGPAAAKSPVEEPSAETPAAKPRTQCFWTHQVRNFASSDDRTINIRVGAKDIYRFEMFGHCTDIDWTHEIALVSRGGSSICAGMDAEIVTPTPIGPQRCPVRNIRKLTPDEIKALPKRARP